MSKRGKTWSPHALEPEFACPVTAKSAFARGFEATAASEAGVEVVEHGGRDEVVIAHAHILVALGVAAGVKRPEALGADVRHVAGEVTACDFVARVDVLVYAY